MIHLSFCRENFSALVDEEGKRSFLDPNSRNTYTADLRTNAMVCNTRSFQRRLDGRAVKKRLQLKCTLGPHINHNHRGLNDKEVLRARLEFRCRIRIAGYRDWTKARDCFDAEYARTPITGWNANQTFAQMELGMFESAIDGGIYEFGAKLGYSNQEHQLRRHALRLVKRAKRYVAVKSSTLRDGRRHKDCAAPAA